ACDRKVERLEGSVARYTWSNYYYDLKKRLRRLANVLSRSYKMHYRIYCNGPIAEKPLAVKAGIGYYGKHSIILNKDFGSWVVIGEIITDLEIETDAPLEEDCGDCHLCIDSCPTGAIKKPYQLDWSRCIQYLSNHRARVGEDIFEAWGNRLYGCTTCQEVCPKNRYKKQSHPIPEYGYVGPSLPLLDILILDEARFRERYHRNQIGARWVELACLKRNAILALAHSGDRRVSNHIRRFKDDPDPMIAAAARWAIKRLSCSW
ncbi:MAG TPA: tRNA epoxyqueuosine(34) reductase QueG, partial [bacterium (Candidatus Stahlbacteria)]|nr:tRNA epoxyqueuosine(34) reductase QueG [Candidatus Stahlbacteria bacterium]